MLSRIPDKALNEIISGKIYKDGKGLSKRIWQNTKYLEKDIGYIIQKGLLEKKSAIMLAKDLEAYLNPKARTDFNWSKCYPKLAYKKCSYESQSLARTSINHAYQLSSSERKIDELVISKDKKLGNDYELTTYYKPLDEEIKKACLDNGIGISFLFSYAERKFIFDVIFGKDLTASQSKLPPVIFSPKFENIFEQKLIDESSDYKNTIIAGGKGEGLNREIITVFDESESKGIFRKEVFADIRDSDVTSESLPVKAKERFQEYPKIFTLDGKINPKAGLVFENDYNLGDLVTMRFDSVTMDSRITKVIESWDVSGYHVECTFGNKMPTLLDKIKNGVR